MLRRFTVDRSSPLQPTTSQQTNAQTIGYGKPSKVIEDWRVRTFTPKWFGLSIDPIKITYQTTSRKPLVISVVARKHDFKIRMCVDGQDQDLDEVALDPTIDCDNSDVKGLISSGVAYAFIEVPHGRHVVTAEMIKGVYNF